MISLVVLLIAARTVASTASDGSGSEDAETALPDLKTATDTCADLVDEHGNWLTAIEAESGSAFEQTEACIWVLTYDGGGHLLLGVKTAGDRARTGLHLLSGLQFSMLPQQHKVTWLYDVQAARARWPSEVDRKLLSRTVHTAAGACGSERKLEWCPIPAACLGSIKDGKMSVSKKPYCKGLYTKEEIRQGLSRVTVLLAPAVCESNVVHTVRGMNYLIALSYVSVLYCTEYYVCVCRPPLWR